MKLLGALVMFTVVGFLRGSPDSLCAPNKDPLQCNGTAATNELTNKLTECDCLVKKFESSSKPPMGRFTPQCEDNGEWSPMQFHGSTGLSWCVEPKNGVNITEKARAVYKACKCLVDEYMVNQQEKKIGEFKPKCNSDGTFEKKQLRSSTGVSFCSEPMTGVNLLEAGRGQNLTCECVIQKHEAQAKNAMGAFIPLCEKDGTFSKKQTHGSIGMSWCVDPLSGQNITEPIRGELKCE